MNRIKKLTLGGMVVSCITSSIAWGAGWNYAVTLISVEDNNFNGEVVQFAVSQSVDNSAGCSNATMYAIRDSATMHGSLAILTAALLAGRPVDIWTTGTCDPTGFPQVVGVALH